MNLKDTYKNLINYVKSGAHAEHKNTDEFVQMANEAGQENGLGHCGSSIAPHAFKFFGFTAAELKGNTFKSPTWSNHCFQENYASFTWISDYEAKVVIHASRPKYIACSDTYSITDIYNYDLKVVDSKGDHEIIYKFEEQHGVDFVKKFGLKIIRLCDSHVHLLPDIYLTLALFAGDKLVEGEEGAKTPKAIRDAIFAYHYDWLHHWSGYPLKKRHP
jgi:hypothetical protein